MSGKIGGGPIAPQTSVLEHHGAPTRSGFYTSAGVAPGALHVAWKTAVDGKIYAQPLFLDVGGDGALIAVTERNQVYALDAGTGAILWQRNLAAPVPLSSLPCGNIDPLGITGTPVVDASSRTLYLDAMTPGPKHLVYALSVDDGSTRSGWPVDVSAAARSGGVAFDSSVQNQRAALALLGGEVYVAYGGHYGDCGEYHGWVVGISTGNPSQVGAWATPAQGGGIWGPGGIASDGTSIFVTTGNTFGATAWAGGEAVVRLGPGAVFSGAPADYFAPSNWQQLDDQDADLGGSGVSIVGSRLVALGKDGKAYLVDKANMGGVGGAVASTQVSPSEIITGPASYSTSKGTYLVFRSEGQGCPSGQSGDLVALAVKDSSVSVAWCADAHGRGSPIATANGSGAVVWTIGAQGDSRLHAYDGDTGAELGQSDAVGAVRAYQTPVAAKGRMYIGGDNAVYALAP